MGISYPNQLFRPGSRVVVDHAAKSGFQVLVHSLSRPIGLGVEARKQTDRGPNEATKLLPEHGCELGPPVRDDVRGQSMETKDVLENQFSSFFGRGKLGKGNEVGHLGKTVDNCEDSSLALGCR